MRIAIVSLRFAPGHIAHLRAYESLFLSLGCETKMFLDPQYQGFLDQDQNNRVYMHSIDEIINYHADVVLSYNISDQNIKLSRQCKKRNTKFIYILHEPWDSFVDLLAQRGRMPRRIVANIVNYITCLNAYKVVLASENGKMKYEKYMHSCNKNYEVFPLIFCDDYDKTLIIERKYFSFIGGFTETRGCSAFLKFIEFSIENDSDIRFVIASRNNVMSSIQTSILIKAMETGLLQVFDGKPMTSNEINYHYRESICVWNAYNFSTQSGVLPNALMQGAPVLVSKQGISEEVITDRREGCFVSLPHNNIEIMEAYNYIRSHQKKFENNARMTFLSKYHYKEFLDKANSVFLGK